MEFIGIQDVLRRTNLGYENGKHIAFSIKWVKENGQIKHIPNAARWVKDPILKKQYNVKASTKKSRVNYNKTDTILIFDLNGKGSFYRTVKIPTIIEFENYPVKH